MVWMDDLNEVDQLQTGDDRRTDEEWSSNFIVSSTAHKIVGTRTFVSFLNVILSGTNKHKGRNPLSLVLKL